MTEVIDRRQKENKGRGSRDRLIQRTKEAAREAIDRAFRDGEIEKVGKDGVDVTVPKGGLSEPHFHHDKGGVDHRVLPGNNNEKARFRVGDRVPRPEGGGAGGSGNQASNEGESEDSFIYHLSEKEFLDILFEDLELPNMFKITDEDSQQLRYDQDGFSHAGSFNRLSLARSKLEKNKRNAVMNHSNYLRMLELLDEKKTILGTYGSVGYTPNVDTPSLKRRVDALDAETTTMAKLYGGLLTWNEDMQVSDIDSELSGLRSKTASVSRWNDRTDLRYRAVEEEKVPNAKAVMFCEMDVSASMDEEKKSNAKLFYFLLHRFLKRSYEQVDIVWIRHTEKAKEVDEKEFFESQETGGTVVSSAHELMLDILKKRYSGNEWNIYAAQASDGDNYTNDNAKTHDLMKEILPLVQGFFYIETSRSISMGPTDIWKTYEGLTEEFPHSFWRNKVVNRKEIWPVFREFFLKKSEAPTGTPHHRSSAFNFG